MQKILTIVAASFGVVAAVSASQACEFHNMATQTGQPQQVVAMSTAPAPTIVEDTTAKAAAKECAAGAKDCPPQADK